MTRFFYTPEIELYDFGPQHPLKYQRFQLTLELLERYGVFQTMPVEIPRMPSEEELLLIHTSEYLDVVKTLSAGDVVPEAHRYGFSELGDNPPFAGMWEAARAYTGATICATEAVLEGENIAISIGGGLHHALPSRASGFCVLADPAIALEMLKKRFKRLAYVDIDLHHGDGPQWIFYRDPDVLTVSIHESGQWLFPGTGNVTEIGEEEGKGACVNIPLAPLTGDKVWQHAFETIGMGALQRFQPEAIVLQMGSDPHALDPLGHLHLSAQGWVWAVEKVKNLGLPIVALGGGGYNLTTVPRMWTMAIATLAGIPLPDETPETFSRKADIPRLTDEQVPSLSIQEQRAAEEFAEQTIDWIRTNHPLWL